MLLDLNGPQSLVASLLCGHSLAIFDIVLELADLALMYVPLSGVLRRQSPWAQRRVLELVSTVGLHRFDAQCS